MAKFYGAVGYSEGAREIRPGVSDDIIIERYHRGEILRDIKKYDSSNNVVDNLNINNRISIIADQYAYTHASMIRYVVLYGSAWKVTNVEFGYPRLILTLGGVYNGPTADRSSR